MGISTASGRIKREGKKTGNEKREGKGNGPWYIKYLINPGTYMYQIAGSGPAAE